MFRSLASSGAHLATRTDLRDSQGLTCWINWNKKPKDALHSKPTTSDFGNCFIPDRMSRRALMCAESITFSNKSRCDGLIEAIHAPMLLRHSSIAPSIKEVNSSLHSLFATAL